MKTAAPRVGRPFAFQTTAMAIAGNSSNAMQLKHHESERKPRTRRGGKDNPPPGRTRLGNAGKSARPTAETRYAVYDGTPFSRIGSFRHDGDSFEAFDRLGRSLGTFSSERAVIAAIERRCAP
jgi:hypothetical protein